MSSQIADPRKVEKHLTEARSSVANPTSNLGKLADLRAPASTTPSITRPVAATTPSTGAPRGWTSVVTAQPRPAPPSQGWGVMPARNTSLPSSRSSTPGNLVPLGSRSTTHSSNPTRQSVVPTRVTENVPDNWENDDM